MYADLLLELLTSSQPTVQTVVPSSHVLFIRPRSDFA